MRAVAAALSPARRVLIMAHRDPDGDALGSVLGLAHLLRAADKEIRAHRAGLVPAEYALLPGLELAAEDLPAPDWPDLVVLMDCHEPQRAGKLAEPYLRAQANVAVIDHHLGRPDFGQAVWVEPSHAATAQMVAKLAAEMGLPLSPQAASCLFVGLITDTGRFCYSNTTPEVLRIAADLVAAGADPWGLTQQVYSTSAERLKLFGRVVDGLELKAGGRLALAKARQRDLDELGCPSSDLDRIVEELRAIRGVEVAVLLKEIDDGSVKASLRSRGRVDVAQLALGLGGGGHKNAAGARLAAGLDQAAATLTGLLEPRLRDLAERS
ncbi:MAG: bifunctional oligoribonuclease/PAP phosphatase NrnA [Pseudomonadota bacterium]